jgi:hypothetical protein
MNKNFYLTENGKRRAKLVMLRKMLIPFIIFEIILFGALIIVLHLNVLQIVIVAIIAFLMAEVFVIRTKKNPALSFKEWGLHLDETSIYLTENPQDSEIRCEELGSLMESSDGLIVKGKKTSQRIWIPAGVEDYDNVKKILESWLRNVT